MNTRKLTNEQRIENTRKASKKYYHKNKDDPDFKKMKAANRIKWETENPDKLKAGMKAAAIIPARYGS